MTSSSTPTVFRRKRVKREDEGAGEDRESVSGAVGGGVRRAVEIMIDRPRRPI